MANEPDPRLDAIAHVIREIHYGTGWSVDPMTSLAMKIIAAWDALDAMAHVDCPNCLGKGRYAVACTEFPMGEVTLGCSTCGMSGKVRKHPDGNHI